MLLTLILGFTVTAVVLGFMGLYLRTEVQYLYNQISQLSGRVYNLPDQMTNTIKSVQSVAREHDTLEGSINDVAREMEKRIANAHRDWGSRMDAVVKEFKDKLAVNMDCKSYTDMKIGKLAADLFEELRAAGEKNLRDTHRAVWQDLDGTLTTIRTDMDSSLNQRTVKLQDQIKESGNNSSAVAALSRNIEMIEASLGKLEIQMESIENADHGSDLGMAYSELVARIEKLERYKMEPQPEAAKVESTNATSSLVEQLLKVGMEKIKDPDVLSRLLKKVIEK
jgi:BMFP domain-containing protein YqiC